MAFECADYSYTYLLI